MEPRSAVTQALEQLQSAVLGLAQALAAREAGLAEHSPSSPELSAAAPALPTLYTPEEAAAWLRCERTKVYAMVRAGELQAFHLGTGLRITQTELQRWLDGRADHGRRTTDDRRQQSGDSPAAPRALRPASRDGGPVKLQPRRRVRLGVR